MTVRKVRPAAERHAAATSSRIEVLVGTLTLAATSRGLQGVVQQNCQHMLHGLRSF